MIIINVRFLKQAGRNRVDVFAFSVCFVAEFLKDLHVVTVATGMTILVISTRVNQF